jgi:hypothetical protein|eukprot:5987803-Prymnesium_polylepis.2
MEQLCERVLTVETLCWSDLQAAELIVKATRGDPLRRQCVLVGKYRGGFELSTTFERAITVLYFSA